MSDLIDAEGYVFCHWCGFCAAEVVMEGDRRYVQAFRVECQRCFSRGPAQESETKAVSDWYYGTEWRRLAESVMGWWREHQYDTVVSHNGEYNVYSDEPEFVAIARAITL